MPFQLRRLDTRIPATWDGTDEFELDPHVDDDTWLRASVGEDKTNYFSFQRPQGDLFKRDLISEQNLRNMANFLATRTGLRYGGAAVRLGIADALILGRVTIPAATPRWYVVGGELKNITDAVVGASLEVMRDSDSVVIWSTTSYGTTFAAAALTDRGPLLVAGQTYTFRLINGTGAKKIFSGSILVQPRTYA
jgi:hypothetical protein